MLSTTPSATPSTIPSTTARRGRRRPAARATAAAAVAASLLLAGCAGDGEDDAAAEVDASTEGVEATAAPAPEDVDEGTVEVDPGEPTVSAEDLVGNAPSFVGETVVVEAWVDQVLGEEAFVLVDEVGGEPAGPEQGLLVLGAVGELVDDQQVVVSGQVREGLDVAEAEESYGDLPDDQVEAYADGYWLDAAAVQVVSD